MRRERISRNDGVPATRSNDVYIWNTLVSHTRSLNHKYIAALCMPTRGKRLDGRFRKFQELREHSPEKSLNRLPTCIDLYTARCIATSHLPLAPRSDAAAVIFETTTLSTFSAIRWKTSPG